MEQIIKNVTCFFSLKSKNKMSEDSILKASFSFACQLNSVAVTAL